jgi:hypothetical protein
VIFCRKFEWWFNRRDESKVNGSDCNGQRQRALSIEVLAAQQFARSGEERLTVPVCRGFTIATTILAQIGCR